MTVSTAYSVLQFAGNDVTVAHAVSWPFFDADDLVVTLIDAGGVETVQTLTTHYTVSGGTDANGLPATGTVTMVTAAATGETIQIERVTDRVQASEWTKSGPFSAKTLEAALDRAILIAQEEALRNPWRSAWVTGQGYLVGDLVSNDGSTYVCTAAHTAGASTEPGTGGSWTSYWDLYAEGGADGAAGANGADGADGADGTGITWQGAWVTATAYVADDSVQNDGSSYICTLAHTSGASSEPGTGGSWTTYWDLIAAKGAAGAGTGDLLAANNLSDVANTATAATNLGLGTASAVTHGTLALGVDDTTAGTANIYGGATVGAKLSLYNSAADDTTIERYQLSAHEVDGAFCIRRIDTGAGEYREFRMGTDGTIYLAQNSGVVHVGGGDTTPAVLHLNGGGTGEAAGSLRIYNDADNDGTVDYWEINGESGELKISANGTTDGITIETDGTVAFDQYANGYLYVDANGDATALGEATAAEYRNNTASKVLTTDIVWAAMAEVTLSDGANISWDMNSGIDFTVTLAGNRTLDNATNVIVGKKGRLRVVQDGTGSRTLSFGTNYEFAGGTAVTLTTAASAEDILFYDCISATRILITSVLDIS